MATNVKFSKFLFCRTYKGTPAYAVALNFNSIHETVSFSGTPHFKNETEGTIEIDSRKESLVHDSKYVFGNLY